LFVSSGRGKCGHAFASRLASCNVPAVIGVRDPDAAHAETPWSAPAHILSVGDAVAAARVLVLAIPHAAHAEFVGAHAHALREKVLVDVANPVTPGMTSCLRTIAAKVRGGGVADVTGGESSAQRLQTALVKHRVAGCAIVKAFNSVSAYELESPAARLPPPIVAVSSDDEAARELVMNLARKMGFGVLDFGGIDNAILQERTVHKFFDGWVAAVTFGTLLLIGLTIYWANTYYAGHDLINTFFYNWAVNPVGDVAAVLLAFTLLPGSITAIWQLVRGTARRPFPAWFASWLNIRKQLGLLGFFLAVIHGFCGTMEGGNVNETTPVPAFYEYTWYAFGPITLAFFGVLAACSGQAVSASEMSWMEFKFVFTGLGYTTLAMLIVHLGAQIPHTIYESKDYSNKGATIYFPLVVVGVAFVLKCLLSIPPLSSRIARVRSR
jgi:8-hydroxy-5-deazaflavin:NADPH oxidoreductase